MSPTDINGTELNAASSNDQRAFLPHVTVATVVENDGKFLFVEEMSSGQRVINQPAGHLEENESLIQAAERETLEETGCVVKIVGVLGVQLFTSPNNGVTYHRTTFSAELERQTDAELDQGILQAIWLSQPEAKTYSAPPRSPLVFEALDRFQRGLVFPLSILDLSFLNN